VVSSSTAASVPTIAEAIAALAFDWREPAGVSSPARGSWYESLKGKLSGHIYKQYIKNSREVCENIEEYTGSGFDEGLRRKRYKVALFVCGGLIKTNPELQAGTYGLRSAVYASVALRRSAKAERISSCPAESTVNAVISKRFAKRQQMQWTMRDAHLLLQMRIAGTRRHSAATVRALAQSIILINQWCGIDSKNALDNAPCRSETPRYGPWKCFDPGTASC